MPAPGAVANGTAPTSSGAEPRPGGARGRRRDGDRRGTRARPRLALGTRLPVASKVAGGRRAVALPGAEDALGAARPNASARGPAREREGPGTPRRRLDVFNEAVDA